MAFHVNFEYRLFAVDFKPVFAGWDTIYIWILMISQIKKIALLLLNHLHI